MEWDLEWSKGSPKYKIMTGMAVCIEKYMASHACTRPPAKYINN